MAWECQAEHVAQLSPPEYCLMYPREGWKHEIWVGHVQRMRCVEDGLIKLLLFHMERSHVRWFSIWRPEHAGEAYLLWERFPHGRSKMCGCGHGCLDYIMLLNLLRL